MRPKSSSSPSGRRFRPQYGIAFNVQLSRWGISVKGLMSLKTTILAATALGTLAATPAWAELKIGVVDYGRLVEESPQAKAALDVIRKEFNPRQRELQTQQTAL